MNVKKKKEQVKVQKKIPPVAEIRAEIKRILESPDFEASQRGPWHGASVPLCNLVDRDPMASKLNLTILKESCICIWQLTHGGRVIQPSAEHTGQCSPRILHCVTLCKQRMPSHGAGSGRTRHDQHHFLDFGRAGEALHFCCSIARQGPGGAFIRIGHREYREKCCLLYR